MTLDPQLSAEPRETVAAEAIDAVVNEAVRRHRQALRIRKLLREMEERSGPIPEEMRRQARDFPWPA